MTIERRELELTLQTVTPLLLAGANNQMPEIRAPALRGAMRYWWRATLGGVIGDSNLDGLRLLETMVFGSPDKGSGGCGYGVSVRGRMAGTYGSPGRGLLARCEDLAGGRSGATGCWSQDKRGVWVLYQSPFLKSRADTTNLPRQVAANATHLSRFGVSEDDLIQRKR